MTPTAAATRNGKSVAEIKTRKPRSDVFNFLNSTAAESTTEIIRRNWGRKSSNSGVVQGRPCMKCLKKIKKKDRYYSVTSQKLIHLDCLLAEASPEQKVQVMGWQEQTEVVSESPVVMPDAPVKRGRKKGVKQSKPVKVLAQDTTAESAATSLQEDVSNHLTAVEEISNVELNYKMGLYHGQCLAHEKWLEKLPELLRAAKCGETK